MDIRPFFELEEFNHRARNFAKNVKFTFSSAPGRKNYLTVEYTDKNTREIIRNHYHIPVWLAQAILNEKLTLEANFNPNIAEWVKPIKITPIYPEPTYVNPWIGN